LFSCLRLDYPELIEYRLKCGIPTMVEELLSTGRSVSPLSPEKSPFQISMFQPVIIKNAEKSNGLFLLDTRFRAQALLINVDKPNKPKKVRPAPLFISLFRRDCRLVYPCRRRACDNRNRRWDRSDSCFPGYRTSGIPSGRRR